MAFRKVSSGEEDTERQIVIWVYEEDGKLLGNMSHPLETATLVNHPLNDIVSIAEQQSMITPGRPEVVVIDEDNLWPQSYTPLTT